MHRAANAAGALAFFVSCSSLAHHGVAGLGAVGLRGPGAPLESTTSATLPVGSTLSYLKFDRADYETYLADPAEPESDNADFWILGLGHGLTSWASMYIFLPYNRKIDEPGGFNTSGFADISIFGQIGIKYDEGFQLVPDTESLDDLEDWHMTLYAGLSLPTGDPDIRNSAGEIDPGKSTSFGSRSYSVGVAATKLLSERWTYNQELSTIVFQEHTYADGNRTRFGSELRSNTAAVYRLHVAPETNSRVDLSLEAQYLSLGRDRTNGIAEFATGGEMLYIVPGVRYYKENFSIGVGIKVPVWTDLNEERFQQGAEGTEDRRLILTFSALL
jgi:hypothetical protein